MVPHIKDADVHMINNQEFNSRGQDIIEDPIEKFNFENPWSCSSLKALGFRYSLFPKPFVVFEHNARAFSDLLRIFQTIAI